MIGYQQPALKSQYKTDRLSKSTGTMQYSTNTEAILDITLRPRCAICCHCIRRQSQTTWGRPPPRANTLEVLTIWFSKAPTSLLPTPRAMWPSRENVTSSTKPEVHNVLHYGQRRTELRPHLTCSENFVKLEHDVFEIRERTDRHTDRHTHALIAILRTPPGAN